LAIFLDGLLPNVYVSSKVDNLLLVITVLFINYLYYSKVFIVPIPNDVKEEIRLLVDSQENKLRTLLYAGEANTIVPYVYTTGMCAWTFKQF